MSYNDVVSKPGTQPNDIGVQIHECQSYQSPGRNQTTSESKSSNETTPPPSGGASRPDCPKRFLDFLRYKVVRGGPRPADTKLKKEEAAAYKDLLISLESVPDELSRYPSAVHVTAHAALLAAFLATLVAARSVPEVHARWIFHMRIHRWVALVMVVVSGLPCIRFVTLVVSEPTVWFWKTLKYPVYFARRIKMSLDVMLWFLLVLWVWYTWCRPDIVKDTHGAKTLGIPVPQYEEAVKMGVKQVTRVLIALTLGAFFWTMKAALFSRLHANLHYKDLCTMIRRAILDFHAIQFICHKGDFKSWSFLKDEQNDPETTNFWMDVSHLRKGSAPIWILKKLSSKFMEHMKGKKPEIFSDLDPTNDDDEFMERAKILYNKFSIIKTGQTIDLSPRIDSYGLERKGLDIVFKLFDSNNNRQITEAEFLRWAVKALKGCFRLKRVIESSKRIFVKLNMLMSSCVVALVIVIWLLISEVVTTAQLAILFAPLVSASFVFGESLKRTFDGLIFVFGMHPFDVDQHVIIDNVKMKASELKLLTTVFLEYETGDEIIYPNSVLATKYITKLDLTEKYMPDSVEFTVPVDTPEELITDLGFKIKKSLDDELAITSESTMVAKKEISDTNITLIVHFKYLVAYHTAENKARHRSKTLETIVRFREEMKRVKEMDNATDKEKDKYEADDTVMVLVDSTKKMAEIEEIKTKLTEILQGCRSSKDCSKVLFTGIEGKKVNIAIHIRFRKDTLKPGDKEDIKQKIDQEKSKLKGAEQ